MFKLKIALKSETVRLLAIPCCFHEQQQKERCVQLGEEEREDSIVSDTIYSKPKILSWILWTVRQNKICVWTGKPSNLFTRSCSKILCCTVIGKFYSSAHASVQTSLVQMETHCKIYWPSSLNSSEKQSYECLLDGEERIGESNLLFSVLVTWFLRGKNLRN